MNMLVLGLIVGWSCCLSFSRNSLIKFLIHKSSGMKGLFIGRMPIVVSQILTEQLQSLKRCSIVSKLVLHKWHSAGTLIFLLIRFSTDGIALLTIFHKKTFHLGKILRCQSSLKNFLCLRFGLLLLASLMLVQYPDFAVYMPFWSWLHKNVSGV